MSLLKKKADVPADVHQLEAPVSKEYDAVSFVYNDMYQNQITSIPWRDFQKRYQQFAQKYNKLFTEIRHNKPQVTLTDLFDWLQEAKDESNYQIEYESYSDPETSFRDVEQLVLQLNQGANAERILAQDPIIRDYVEMVAQGGQQSGHPVSLKTVGWLRVDFVDDNWLLIDEVQSDLVNSVIQAKNIVTTPTFEGFVENLTNPKVRDKVLEKVTPDLFYGLQRHFRQKGYTPEKLDEIKNRLVELFEDWAEWGIASLLKIAREHGIKNVAIHTAETISQRDESVEADKVKMYYDNLAKSFGFKKQQLNVGDLQGNFWVRTAAKKRKKPDFDLEMDFHSAVSTSQVIYYYDMFKAGRLNIEIEKLPWTFQQLFKTYDEDPVLYENVKKEVEKILGRTVAEQWEGGIKKEFLKDGAKRKLDPNKKLIDDPKLYAVVRSDPRQTSLYGPEHEQELQDIYANPKPMQASLLQDFGNKAAGLYSLEDLDDHDSPLVYDLMKTHDEIHLNPVRGVVPDYGSEYQGQQIWQFTFGAVKNDLLPAVREGTQKCTPAGKKKINALVDEATTALAESASAARMRQYREAGKKVEFAFGKLHVAIEIIRMETRKKQNGKPMPVGVAKSLGDYT